MEFVPHCPTCAVPQNVSFHDNGFLEYVGCIQCHQSHLWGTYRIGTGSQDPSYSDLCTNQRLKPFLEAAEVRGWSVAVLLEAWRGTAAEGPLAARWGKDPWVFGETLERMMDANHNHQVRFDLSF